MKRFLTAMSVLAVLCAPALAQSTHSSAAPATRPPAASEQIPPLPSGPLKIATMNFEAAVFYSNEGVREFTALQTKYQPRETQLKTQSDEIESLKKQLQTNGEKLSEDERANRVKAIEAKQKEFQRASEDAQNDFQTDRDAAFQKVAAKVADFINDYAQKNGYSMIYEVGSQAQGIPTVLFAQPGLDITRAIIAGYNEKSGVPAPAASSTPSAPAAHRTPSTHPASH